LEAGEEADGMARAGHGERKRFRRRAPEAPVAFDHWSERDLADIVSDHLIASDKASATSKWHPSRRGNSPHHKG
jgi:hypothetical protein